jgi:hypothetical protein
VAGFQAENGGEVTARSGRVFSRREAGSAGSSLTNKDLVKANFNFQHQDPVKKGILAKNPRCYAEEALNSRFGFLLCSLPDSLVISPKLGEIPYCRPVQTLAGLCAQ